MKESALFLTFVSKNFILLFLPAFLGLLISVYAYSAKPTQTKLSQTFKLEYNIENIDTASLLADQAVTELRLQEFDSGFPFSKAVVYRIGPTSIAIEVFSADRNSGYELLLKETEYLRQNFKVSTVTEPKITAFEPNIFKFLLTGLLTGFFLGLITALFKEYLRNY